MEKFKHKISIQIRFKDVDMMGHVNNANHFTYLELARIKYLDAISGEKINWTKKGIILAKTIIDYKLPILLTDQLFVYTKCSRIGNKSFDLIYKIIKEEAEKQILLAEASTVLVYYDYEKGQSILMPDEWKKKIQEFEK